jgi:hypothetical protein
MKSKALILGVMMVGTLVMISSQVLSQDHQQPSPAEMAEMMAKWQEMGTPGSNHKKLDFFVGKWEVNAKVWMGGPNMPATESKGESEVRWILGGRFLQEDYKNTFMGQPMVGMSLMGYDNFRQQYRSLWIDSFGTGMALSTGNVDASGKVFTFYGKMDEIMTGEIDKNFYFVVKIINENKHVMEMHDPIMPEGQTKVMEMTYTRK